jgi:hypothetical protein
MQRAIVNAETAYEPDHPSVAARYWNLGTIEHADGRTVEARELVHRAHTIFQERLGLEHPSTQMCATWLSDHGGQS